MSTLPTLVYSHETVVLYISKVSNQIHYACIDIFTSDIIKKQLYGVKGPPDQTPFGKKNAFG